LKLPDLWQQQAVRALQAGRDVVVHAPTGAGKTFIFELLFEAGLRKQAVYTVPTRALANDKRAEWRARGWNVGIATGDLAENLDAPVVVATLETQRSALLEGRGPGLLVIDEYQMIGDATRGLAYELGVALASSGTQLLLLSGSVANPQDVAAWMQRIGRPVELVAHYGRPVPLEEIYLEALNERPPDGIRGFWPRMIARALLADLGPILVFAPQRKAAEDLARQLAAALPLLEPLVLSPEQARLAGDRLGKLLRSRVAFHHSGLSYAQRAGVIEPLAKSGQLRVVVATTGLAAGINFSMRSTLVTESEYTANHAQRLVRPDELLQMFGRAGRRGLDEVGYALVAPDRPRLSEARPASLRRPNTVDWPSLIGVMAAAAKRGEDPAAAAARLTARLFSPQAIAHGMEHSAATGPMPCGLQIDALRARHARSREPEMQNSLGLWEPKAEPVAMPLGRVLSWRDDRWRPALQQAATLEKYPFGSLCILGKGGGKRYGREAPFAAPERQGGGYAPTKWLRSLARERWGDEAVKRQLPRRFAAEQIESAAVPLLETLTGGRVVEIAERGGALRARLDFAEVQVQAVPDAAGAGLWGGPERQAYPPECQGCPQLSVCESELSPRRSPALAWRQLGLVDDCGTPTRRGVIFSFFHKGEGLAVAAALEDETYDLETLALDLANLRAGHRFGQQAARPARLGSASRAVYGESEYEGYLERGLPTEYGDGASEALADLAAGVGRQAVLNEDIRPGDLERARLEWHSLLRQVAHAPDYPWERWRQLQQVARNLLTSLAPQPLHANLPGLTAAQQKKVSHRLRW
jgi:hypothetical protein